MALELNSSFVNSSTKVVSFVGEHEEGLKIALEVLLVTLLVFIMLAMGCEITWKELVYHLRHPTGILIGLASQFGVLPLCGFILSKIFKLTVYQSLSLLILSCCPGGALSNLFTMWCKGNISLSICMTTMSTLMALGMMPLNLKIYTLNWETEDITIPYNKLAVTLAITLVPVFVGVIIKIKLPKAADWITRAGSIAGFLSILITIIIQCLLFPALFKSTWQSYLATFLLPCLGFGFGFLCGYIGNMSYKDCRTIAFETGTQNVPLALTITYISFPFEKQIEMVPIQLLYAIFKQSEAVVVSFLYYWWRKMKDSKAAKKSNDQLQKTEVILEENIVMLETSGK